MHAKLFQRANQLDRLLVAVVREGDHDPLHVEQVHDRREPLGRTEQRDVFESGIRLLRLSVDEADEVDAVLGMLLELPRDLLADVTCADDDRVLDVLRAAVAEGARRSAP